MAIDNKFVEYVSNEVNIPLNQTSSVLTMFIDEDCTIPFIARYRKERTGGLDEVQIKDIQDAYEKKVELEKRRLYITETITKMEKMTPDLEKSIKLAETLNKLEDLYAPYKSKKKTKGVKAKEAGLEPLAEILLNSTDGLDQIEKKHAAQYINPDHKINSFSDAIQGACDILIEKFAHDSEIKDQLRKDYWNDALIASKKTNKATEIKDYDKFKDYFDFSQKINELTNPKVGHRFLAMRRGMVQKILKVEVVYDKESAVSFIRNKFLIKESKVSDILEGCFEKSYLNYIHSSLDLEIKTELKKVSDESAIDVFSINLKNLLLQPYLGAKNVLGVDPGIRTGCKIAVVDKTGKFLVDTVIYPHPPKNEREASAIIINAVIEKFQISYVAIGNGTYGRETLSFFENCIPKVKNGDVKATLISEAGASIYSTSEIARKEFPDKDPTVRGAISIARRFQDPLAELVKIDPKSIGVGQYQHDVNQSRLKNSLEYVVESCVNHVGVDLNTASAPLLSHISGIGPSLAENIVKSREKKGVFKSRQELLKVTRFSPKVFQQAAGFLRIYDGENPLDGTFIHPESYKHLENWAETKNVTLLDLKEKEKVTDQLAQDKALSETVGNFTLTDIVKSLTAPSQDPRTEFKSIEFRKDITDIKDLKVQQWYPGVVTNITQFGAFVDIGIKENGLLHVSQISEKFTHNALDELTVGQRVDVRIIDIDLDRKRISLSCKKGETDASYVPNSTNDKRSNKKSHNNNPEFKNNPFAKLKNFKV